MVVDVLFIVKLLASDPVVEDVPIKVELPDNIIGAVPWTVPVVNPNEAVPNIENDAPLIVDDVVGPPIITGPLQGI